MTLIRRLLHAYLYLPYSLHRLTGTGAFGRNQAEYVEPSPPVNSHRLKKALFRYHVKQFHEAACSVATVVGIINAINNVSSPGATTVTQLDILDRVETAHWKERMSDGGYRGRRGLPLPVLAGVVRDSLSAYQISHTNVETIQASKTAHPAKQVRSVLRQRLQDFEHKGECLVIAHFDQGAYLPTLNIPHISPVGGFDGVTGEVVILDVDPLQPRPYKISFNTFYKGIASNYHGVFKPFGYDSGGCVVVNLT